MPRHALCPPNSPQDATLYAPFGLVAISNYLLQAVQYAPLLIGMFQGAPLLAREHEQRTLLLAWSQDVSPARWLWTKLALLGLYVATLTAAVFAVSDHLAHVRSALDTENLFGNPSLFLVSGMLPPALGVCWFAVGVALGAAIRRTLPAALAVIAGFFGLMLGVQWRYPTLMTPLSFHRHFDRPDDGVVGPNALVVNDYFSTGPYSVSNVFDSSGNELNYAELHRMCPDLGPDPAVTSACLVRNHLQTYVTYQPSSRIPAFHLILASGYLGLGAVALAAVWLIVRRTSLSAG